MAAVWDAATLEERREMVIAMLQEVVCDPAPRRIVALKPTQTGKKARAVA